MTEAHRQGIRVQRLQALEVAVLDRLKPEARGAQDHRTTTDGRTCTEKELWLNLGDAQLRSLTEAVDTETPTGRLMFNFLGTIAEYFLDLNRERTLEGLKAAAARGRKGGRRRKLSEEDLAMARALLNDPSIPVAQVAKRLGVSRATFYAYFPGARTRSMSGAG